MLLELLIFYWFTIIYVSFINKAPAEDKSLQLSIVVFSRRIFLP